MNWKLISQLSLFGLAMAIATVSWIPSSIEPFFWLVIFIICSYLIATKCQAKHFLHGFLVSVFNSVWITTIHVIFFDTYMANHSDMAQMNASRMMMVLMGPVFGAGFGLILGLFAFLASKIIKKPNP